MFMAANQTQVHLNFQRKQLSPWQGIFLGGASSFCQKVQWKYTELLQILVVHEESFCRENAAA